LSVEPWLQTTTAPGAALTAEKLDQLLVKYDPDGKERAISYRSYDGTLTIGGRGASKVIDVATGEAKPGPGLAATVMNTARRMHETLLIDAGWLVLASTGVMLALAVIGVAMGLPRLSNTASGWHMGLAWILLPLVVLSPLTGIFLATGVTFQGPPPAAAQTREAPLPLKEALKVVAQSHDLSGLIWLRPLGPRLVARVMEGGEAKAYAVTRQGTVAMPRNWPRLWHEGNFAGIWSSMMNVITSLALLGLLGTGVWMWSIRQIRRARRRRSRLVPAESRA
jgi:uncharacterized iron-regulated membrane protein